MNELLACLKLIQSIMFTITALFVFVGRNNDYRMFATDATHMHGVRGKVTLIKSTIDKQTNVKP